MDQINLNDNRVKLVGDVHVITNMTLEELDIVFPSGTCRIPHSGYDRCCLRKLSSQMIPPGVEWTNISWSAVTEDTNQMHSLVINPERTNIKRSGYYDLRYKIKIVTDEQFIMEFRILKNDSVIIPHSDWIKPASSENSEDVFLNYVPIFPATITDYLVLQARHNDISSKEILADKTFFFCERRY